MKNPSHTVDSLFQLPLAEFTAARNALATHLKKAGKKEEAERVKSLLKPSISAWVVNQLYWQKRTAFDRLMASGELFRKAQAAQLAGKPGDIRAALEKRREVLGEMSRLAADLLTGGGHQPTADMMRRVTTTLEALSTYGDAPGAPQAGRLADDVDPPGFETLAALVPAVVSDGPAPGERSTVLRFQQKTERARPARGPKSPQEEEAERQARKAAAKAAVQAAEKQLREAKTAAERAEAALKKAAAKVKAAEEQRAQAEARLETLTQELAAAKQVARTVASEAEDAAQAVTDAERTLEAARARME